MRIITLNLKSAEVRKNAWEGAGSLSGPSKWSLISLEGYFSSYLRN